MTHAIPLTENAPAVLTRQGLGYLLFPSTQRGMAYSPYKKLRPELDSTADTLPVAPIRPPGDYGLENITAQTLQTGTGEDFLIWHSAALDPQKRTILLFPGNFGHLGESYKDPAITGKDDYYIALIKKAQAQGYQIIAAQHAGFAGSSSAPGEQGFFRGAEKAVDWALAQGIPPKNLHLCGLSLGAPLAAHAAGHLAHNQALQRSGSGGQKIHCLLINGALNAGVILRDELGEKLGNAAYTVWQDRLDTAQEFQRMATAGERVFIRYVRSGEDSFTPADQVDAHRKAAAGLNFSGIDIPGEKHFLRPDQVIAQLHALEQQAMLQPQRSFQLSG